MLKEFIPNFQLVFCLKIISILLIIILLFAVLFSFCIEFEYNLAIDLYQSLKNIYNHILNFEKLITLTFAVSAFWATLRQLQIVQKENIDRLNDEKLKNALIIKSKILGPFQISFERMARELSIEGSSTIWDNLDTISKKDLSINYPQFYVKFENHNREKKNEIILFLLDIESLSNDILYSKVDDSLIKEMVGNHFLSQLKYLLGYIAYFSENETSSLTPNTLKLRKKWDKKLN